MLTDRERLLIRLALSYMASNLDALYDLFPVDSDTDDDEFDIEAPGKLDYNGEILDMPTEEELEQLAFTFQG